MNILKTFRYLFGSTAFVAASAVSLPSQAFAVTDWKPDDAIKGNGSVNPTEVDADKISEWVKTFAMWIIGIAIVMFVLRVVMTAIDRMLFTKVKEQQGGMPGGGGRGSSDSPLLKLPIVIRPYPETDGWGEIFKTFAIQLAICAGAWLIVNFLSGIVLWAFGSLLDQQK